MGASRPIANNPANPTISTTSAGSSGGHGWSVRRDARRAPSTTAPGDSRRQRIGGQHDQRLVDGVRSRRDAPRGTRIFNAMKIAPAHSTTWRPTSSARLGRRVVPEFRHARRSDVERRADAERPPRRRRRYRRRTATQFVSKGTPSCTTPGVTSAVDDGELVGARHDRHGIGQIGAEQGLGPGRRARSPRPSPGQQADGRQPGARSRRSPASGIHPFTDDQVELIVERARQPVGDGDRRIGRRHSPRRTRG